MLPMIFGYVEQNVFSFSLAYDSSYTSERAFARLGNGATCLLSGGAAITIGEHLEIPHRRVDNLVLEGLLRLARDLPAWHAGGQISS